MSFRLACADFTFPLVAHGQALDIIAMLDLEGVDIGLFEGRSHLWPSKEFADLVPNATKLRRELEVRQLQAADVFLQLDPDFSRFAINHPDNARRAHARDTYLRTLEYARALGCGHVTTLPGVAFADEERERSLERATAELEWRVGEARNAGLVFAVEAHVGSLVPTPRDATDLVRRVPGLTLTLDYTHFTRDGLPDAEVAPLVALASHFHVRGACRGRLQVNFSQNTIDYAGLLSEMERTGYAGWLGLEYVWIDWEHCNESDNLSETIRFRDFIRRYPES